MKKETNKKTIKKTSKIIKAKLVKKTKKIVIKKAASKKTFSKTAKSAPKKIEKRSVSRSLHKPERKMVGKFGKKASLKISSEFAIAVILIISGTFAYVFWKSSSGQVFTSNDALQISNPKKDKTVSDVGNEPIEKWKLFRSENFGNEFRLPKNWRIVEEKGRFASEDTAEEINISVEDNSENYTPEKLLEIAQKKDGSAVQLLSGQNGIKIEEAEDEILRKTAKIILGDNIVTVAYSAYGTDGSNLFFEKIVPTFKSVD